MNPVDEVKFYLHHIGYRLQWRASSVSEQDLDLFELVGRVGICVCSGASGSILIWFGLLL